MLQGSETILIVDDDASILALTESMLIRHGYRTITAQGAAEAVHLFEIHPDVAVALALIDVVMPGVNGVELAVRLQELRPDLPVVFMSAYSANAALRPANTRNVPYLGKPFTSIRLVEKIREILDERKSRPGARTAGAD